MPSRVRWRPDEPARELAYRKLHDRIVNQDSCITFLLVELRAVQKRVDKLEKARARAFTADAPVDNPASRLDQCSHL